MKTSVEGLRVFKAVLSNRVLYMRSSLGEKKITTLHLKKKRSCIFLLKPGSDVFADLQLLITEGFFPPRILSLYN